jgi:uncharacterized protein (TIGR04255 family)
MMESIQSLPSFENPPVIEVVCGVLFKPVEGLLAPHLGLLWAKYKSEYPNCREVAPLTPVIERFEGQAEMKFLFADVPPLPRIWFIRNGDNGIIQVQRDRFLHNWKKMRPEEEYPRYHKVIKMFEDRFIKFQSFLSENGLGVIDPLQYEMTYVNHIYQGDGWTKMDEIGNVFPDFCFRGNQRRFLPEPEGLSWRTTFILPNKAGRLHVTIRNGFSKEKNTQILMIELTVRGIGNDKSIDGMLPWFDLAREWIVRGFTDLTSKQVQEKVWRRKE